MTIFLALLALAGWWQAIKQQRLAQHYLAIGYRDCCKLEQENTLLRQQLAAAQRWSNEG